MTNSNNLKLDLLRLRNFSQSREYELVLDVLEAECDMAERQLLAAPNSQVEVVRSMHSRAKSFRELFEIFQKRVVAAGDTEPPTHTESDLAAMIVRNPGEYYG